MVIVGVVMFVIGSQHSYSEVEFQMQISGNAFCISVADSCGNEEFSLIAILFPLQIVLSASGIQPGEVPRKDYFVSSCCLASNVFPVLRIIFAYSICRYQTATTETSIRR